MVALARRPERDFVSHGIKRLPDEYDAAQARGEINRHGQRSQPQDALIER